MTLAQTAPDYQETGSSCHASFVYAVPCKYGYPRVLKMPNLFPTNHLTPMSNRPIALWSARRPVKRVIISTDNASSVREGVNKAPSSWKAFGQSPKAYRKAKLPCVGE